MITISHCQLCLHVPLFILVLSFENCIFMSTVRLWVSGICTRFHIFGFPFPLVINWKKMVDEPRILLPFLLCTYLGLRLSGWAG